MAIGVNNGFVSDEAVWTRAKQLLRWGPFGHGRRSVGGQGDMSPLLFEVEGTPCVLSPLLSGVDIFCNAQLHSNNYSLQFI